jgi:hypothetical protein
MDSNGESSNPQTESKQDNVRIYVLLKEFADGPPCVEVCDTFFDVEISLRASEVLERPAGKGSRGKSKPRLQAVRLFECDRFGWGIEVDLDAVRADAARRSDEAHLSSEKVLRLARGNPDDLLETAARLSLRLALHTAQCDEDREWLEWLDVPPDSPDSRENLCERIRDLMTAYGYFFVGKDRRSTVLTRFAAAVADQIGKVPSVQAAIARNLAAKEVDKLLALPDNDPSAPTHRASAVAMTKEEILRTLHAVITHRLFESGEPASDTELEALQEKFESLGLAEPAAAPGAWRRAFPTFLSRQINAQLMQAFLDMHWAYEIPYILRTNGLISADEDDQIMDVLNEISCENPLEEHQKMWRALLPLLRQAFERANLMGLFD